MLNSIKNIIFLYKNRRELKNWKKRNFCPPSPEFIKQQILKNNNLKNALWIETGTYYGNTTNYLSKISDKVISIEADSRLADLAKTKFKKIKNVNILNGKSEDLLNDILINNCDYKNICIYLDAHLCNDHLKNKNTFGTENNGTPIKLELEFIESQIDNFDNFNLLIDDIRLFDTSFQNYPDNNYLVDWCKKNKFIWEIQQDIFIAKFKR
tara:strand:- start:254 stop:883 length:630 start_codon:yes stop_codon:yes gene_type:complete